MARAGQCSPHLDRLSRQERHRDQRRRGLHQRDRPYALRYRIRGDRPVDGPALPAHGSANLRITGSNWFVDYSHNGDSATSDYFEFTGRFRQWGGQETVGVTITITAPTSPITVSLARAGDDRRHAVLADPDLQRRRRRLLPTRCSGRAVGPPGLSLSSAGVFSGAPTQRGGYTFSVRSTDSKTPTAQFVDKGYGHGAEPDPDPGNAGRHRHPGRAVSQTCPPTVAWRPTPTARWKPARCPPASPCPAPAWSAAPPTWRPATIRSPSASPTPAPAGQLLRSRELHAHRQPSAERRYRGVAGVRSVKTARQPHVHGHPQLNLTSPTVVNLTTAGTATRAPTTPATSPP